MMSNPNTPCFVIIVSPRLNQLYEHPLNTEWCNLDNHIRLVFHNLPPFLVLITIFSFFDNFLVSAIGRLFALRITSLLVRSGPYAITFFSGDSDFTRCSPTSKSKSASYNFLLRFSLSSCSFRRGR